jgi:hypothetical protein
VLPTVARLASELGLEKAGPRTPEELAAAVLERVREGSGTR